MDRVTPRTVWRITSIVEGAFQRSLDVELSVDTTAASVVDAIERAARRNGVVLQRVSPPLAEATE
jgi:hypothetical protein